MSVAVIALGFVIVVPTARSGAAPAPMDLGVAETFAVLAGTGITNTGPTSITGDVGTFPVATETGFGSVTLTGTDHADDATTQQAKANLLVEYDLAVADGPATAVGVELAGQTFAPGVYNSTTFGLTGTVTLDALGDPGAAFVFQASTTLGTAAASAVVLVNGASVCNVFWQVGSSATIGANTHLIGNVLAAVSITVGAGVNIDGRLLALNGAVTLDTDKITSPSCEPPPPTTTVAPVTTVAPPTTTAVPVTTTTEAPTTTTVAPTTTTVAP